MWLFLIYYVENKLSFYDIGVVGKENGMMKKQPCFQAMPIIKLFRKYQNHFNLGRYFNKITMSMFGVKIGYFTGLQEKIRAFIFKI